jgi:hypothetical protein
MAVRHEGPGHLHTAGLTRRLGPQPGDMTSFGHRRSLLGHPIPGEELGPPHGRLTDPQTGVGPRRGYRVPHARAATGVGALYTPGTTVLTPDWRSCPAGACRFSTTRPIPTAPTSHLPRVRLTRHQRGFKQFTRPVFPSPAAARMERAAASAFPRASHPADQEPDDARQGGDKPSSTDLEQRSTSST